jgi:hypothetical protein
MEELLVAVACLNAKGCPETSSLYYERSPQLQEFVLKQEYNLKAAVGPIITQYGAPIIWLASGREATARLTSDFFITCKTDAMLLQYKYSF